MYNYKYYVLYVKINGKWKKESSHDLITQFKYKYNIFKISWPTDYHGIWTYTVAIYIKGIFCNNIIPRVGRYILWYLIISGDAIFWKITSYIKLFTVPIYLYIFLKPAL